MSSESMTILPNDFIINKKHKSLAIDILSYSKLPIYFLSYDFIINLMRFNSLLLKLNLCPTEYDYIETLQTIFVVKDPITKQIIDIPLAPIAEISNKILDVLFELVELLKIKEDMLLSLVPNNCEILFKILSNLDVINCSDIDFLFNNYNYLLRNNIELIQNKFSLSNDITEEINKQLIKQALKEDIRTLLFIPDDKLSYDIIKYAVQNNGFALKYTKLIFILFSKKYKNSKQIIRNIIKYAMLNNGCALEFVDENYLTGNIIKCAMQNNGLALQYVPDDKMADNIIKCAVQNNGYALQFVPEDKLTDEIIELAVRNNGCALQYAICEDEDYNITYILTYEICKLAVQKDALALQYVPYENKTYELCKLAVQSNPLVLKYVPGRIKTDELCMIAVQSNPLVLQFVDNTYLVEELFLSINLKTYDMCKLAVQKDALALEYVPRKFQTDEIINIAFQSNYRALKYIDKDIMTDEIIDLAFQYKTNSVQK
jgi:hypothetical protein